MICKRHGDLSVVCKDVLVTRRLALLWVNQHVTLPASSAPILTEVYLNP